MVKEIRTLFDDYNECMLELDIFGKVVSAPTYTIKELEAIYYEEFKRIKPFPTLESRRYKLSRHVHSAQLIEYEFELELQDNEELVDIASASSDFVTIDRKELKRPHQEIVDSFKYENRAFDDLREFIIKNYDLDTGEEIFDKGIKTLEDKQGTTEEWDGQLDDTEKEERMGVVFDDGVEYEEDSGVEIDEDEEDGIEWESDSGDEESGIEWESNPDTNGFEDGEDYSDDDTEEAFSQQQSQAFLDEDEDSEEYEDFEDSDEYSEDEYDDSDDDLYGSDDSEEEMYDEEESEVEEQDSDIHDEDEDLYDDYSESEDDQESEDSDPEDDDLYADYQEDEDEQNYDSNSESDSIEDSDDPYEDDEDDDLYGDDFGDEQEYEESSDDEDVYDEDSDEDDLYGDDSEDEDLYGDDSEDEDLYGDDSDDEDSYGDESEDEDEDLYGTDEDLDEDEASYDEGEDDDIYADNEYTPDSSQVNSDVYYTPKEEYVEPVKQQSRSTPTINVTVNVPIRHQPERPVAQQPSKMVAQEALVKEQVRTANGVVIEEPVPTDLRQFLRKYPKCDIATVSKFFSKKVIEDALKVGKVSYNKKTGILRLS